MMLASCMLFQMYQEQRYSQKQNEKVQGVSHQLIYKQGRLPKSRAVRTDELTDRQNSN